ncbi:Protein of unknown function, partial [Cotesia congregata]
DAFEIIVEDVFCPVFSKEYMGLCEMLDEPILLGPAIRMFGFKTCPPPVGVYGNQGLEIPMESLPDEFISNKYLVVLELLYEDEKLVVLNIYSNFQ